MAKKLVACASIEFRLDTAELFVSSRQKRPPCAQSSTCSVGWQARAGVAAVLTEAVVFFDRRLTRRRMVAATASPSARNRVLAVSALHAPLRQERRPMVVIQALQHGRHALRVARRQVVALLLVFGEVVQAAAPAVPDAVGKVDCESDCECKVDCESTVSVTDSHCAPFPKQTSVIVERFGYCGPVHAAIYTSPVSSFHRSPVSASRCMIPCTAVPPG